MDYLGDKLNSVTGRALGQVSEMKHNRTKRNRQQQEQQQQQEPGTSQPITTTTARVPPPSDHHQASYPNPLPAPTSQPFGGDSYAFSSGGPSSKAPPIGFHLNKGDVHKAQLASHGSDRSLYEGDTWSRLWFQRLMILTLLRLILFIRKVYEDYQATKHYKSMSSMMFGHFLLALATLLLPTVIFTIYRLARYLQLALAAHHRRPRPQPSSLTIGDPSGGDRETRALMSDTPTPSSPPPPTAGLVGVNGQEEDGLVTARQTPTNQGAQETETFHEAQAERTGTPTSPSPAPAPEKTPPPTTQVVEEAKESVEVDKLGTLPDREGTRIIIGASEQLLHGALFIFWQLKRQVDVVGYLVERSCMWRKPSEEEKKELERLSTGSDGLEWFQDFYAAFLATLAQVYALGLHWTSPNHNSQLLSHQLSAATDQAASSSSSSLPDSSISQTARAISNALQQQQQALGGQDLLIMSQLVVSLLVVSSLLVAVRRRDDGPLTLLLSMLGWASIFGSRIIVIALAFVHIGWRLMLALVLCHIMAIAAWIYKIAIDSHNDKPGESEESRWADEDVELEETPTKSSSSKSPPASPHANNNTSQWSVLEHLVLIAQILILFALPSLFYWPIMFNLKLHYRPYKYLVLVLTENFLLIPAIWFHISAATAGQWYLLSAAAAFSTVGFIFIFLYISCKPSLTEYFARADELFNEAERSGIYFEFCSRVFKLPDLSKHTFRRLMNQQEQEEEELAAEVENEES